LVNVRFALKSEHQSAHSACPLWADKNVSNHLLSTSSSFDAYVSDGGNMQNLIVHQLLRALYSARKDAAFTDASGVGYLRYQG
jgi:hypothetical protein